MRTSGVCFVGELHCGDWIRDSSKVSSLCLCPSWSMFPCREQASLTEVYRFPSSWGKTRGSKAAFTLLPWQIWHSTGTSWLSQGCCCSVTMSDSCDPMDCSTPGSSVLHCLPEFEQIHVHWVNDVIQPSYPLSSPSPPAFNLSQHQGLFQWVGSSRQSWQWIFRVDFF